ncbi:MAG TPA: hypothetical protein VI076_14200, partial [Actinopolymorphaceae bacterium]
MHRQQQLWDAVMSLVSAAWWTDRDTAHVLERIAHCATDLTGARIAVVWTTPRNERPMALSTIGFPPERIRKLDGPGTESPTVERILREVAGKSVPQGS